MRPEYSATRIFLGFFVLWFSYKAVLEELDGKENGMVGWFYFLPLFILGALTLVMLFLEREFYRKFNRIHNYTLTIVGGLSIMVVFAMMIYHDYIDNSRTILELRHKPGETNVLTYEFKTNGNLRLIEYELFGSTVYYGKYSRKDDTLRILRVKNPSNGTTIPRIGFIKKDTVFWDDNDTMYIDKK